MRKKVSYLCMKTIEEYLKEEGFEPNEHGVFKAHISGYDINLGIVMQDYATEAIKADREKVVNIKIDHGDSFILPKYEKDCILNLQIELP